MDKVHDVELARAILKEAQVGGFLELGNYYAEEADKAFEAGMRHDAVIAILNLGNSGKREQTTQSDSASSPDEKVKETYPRRSSGGYSESDERETEQTSKEAKHDQEAFEVIDGKIDKDENLITKLINDERLPIPKDWEEDPRDIPRDLTPLADVAIRSLHGEYNAYLARARYLLVLEKADLRNAAILRDEALRQAILEVERVDPETKKSKTKDIVEAEAMADKTYKLYAGHATNHQTRADAFQTLVDIYSGNVSTLSREWTMRQDEFNKAR